MSEGKVVVPPYVRVGICKQCGADVYGPEGGGLPLMSSCRCLSGRRGFVSGAEAERPNRARPDGSKGKGKAKAA